MIVSVVNRLSVLISVAAYLSLSTPGMAGCPPELGRLLEFFSTPKFSAVSFGLDTRILASACYRLGLPVEKVTIREFGKGALNHVYRLVSLDPAQPVRFPYAAIIDPELRGQAIDDFVLKIADKSVTPPLAKRDSRVLAAIKRVLGIRDEFEGIRIADTYFLNEDEDGARLIVQRISHGKGLLEVLRPYLKPVLGSVHNGEGSAHELFSHLIEADIRGDTVEQVFSDKNLTGLDGRLLVGSREGLAKLRVAWTEDPKLVRVRELMKQLYRLSRSSELGNANLIYRLNNHGMTNQMPWTTGRNLLPKASPVMTLPFSNPGPMREHVNGDFGFRNFFLVEDPEGTLFLELVDF